MTDPIRLSKRLIAITGCSRREAELYIEGGWVTVDGIVVDEPQFKVCDQAVALLPDAVASPPEPATLLLHQPAAADSRDAEQLLIPANLSPEHRNLQRLLKSHLARLQTSLPLQTHASGLLVFTQDWRILRKLTDDAKKLEQEYTVEVSGEMVNNGLKHLSQGNFYEGKSLPPVKASWQSENRLRFAMKDLQPGQIYRLCASVGLNIVSLKRIRIGGVAMGKLAPGQWRYLAAGERF